MIIEMNSLVVCENGVEIVRCHGMRMCSNSSQNHEIRNIDDANSQLWSNFLEEGSCGNNFKHHFCTDSTNHHIRINTLIRRRKTPDRRASLTMSIRFVGGQPNWRRSL